MNEVLGVVVNTGASFDRLDGQMHACRARRIVRVARLVGECVLAGEVGDGRINKGAGLIERQGAVLGPGYQRCRQRITVGIHVVAEHPRPADRERGVLVEAVRIIVRRRCVVAGQDVDGDRRGVDILPVRDIVGETVDAGKPRGRGITYLTVHDLCRAVRRLTQARYGQRVRFDVRVVRQHVDIDRDALRRSGRVVFGHWWIVDRRYRQRHGSDVVGIDGSIVDAIGERVRAKVIRYRRVGERAVCSELQLPMRGARYERGNQRVAVHVRIVAQHPWCCDRERRVFRRLIRIIRTRSACRSPG